MADTTASSSTHHENPLSQEAADQIANFSFITGRLAGGLLAAFDNAGRQQVITSDSALVTAITLTNHFIDGVGNGLAQCLDGEPSDWPTFQNLTDIMQTLHQLCREVMAKSGAATPEEVRLGIDGRRNVITRSRSEDGTFTVNIKAVDPGPECDAAQASSRFVDIGGFSAYLNANQGQG